MQETCSWKARDLLKGELLVQEECQNKAGPNKKVMAKSVEVSIITSPDHRVKTHAPHNGQGARNEHHLHDGVVNGDEVGDQIQITCHKHHCV